ncbi:MAG: flagellar biosynthetic protein FliP [Gammaproteobacteria bacterium]|nr:MAG: flagellar biosynthetic protein FliP [Gammaproteobacteria bacterium]
MWLRVWGLLAALAALWAPAAWGAGLEAVTVTAAPGGGQSYSVSLQVLVLMTLLTLLPAALLTMTSFTRIVIVLALLRQALGTQQVPPNQLLVGVALFLTAFVMAPVFDQAYQQGVRPYLEDRATLPQALEAAGRPLRAFMLAQTREADLDLFLEMAGREGTTPEEAPLSVVVPAFVTSELKTAFQIGFLIFVPFLVIDLVVASVLMAMGMMMLSPLIISLPFKIMLFVLVDGWTLVLGTLASSFYTG